MNTKVYPRTNDFQTIYLNILLSAKTQKGINIPPEAL